MKKILSFKSILSLLGGLIITFSLFYMFTPAINFSSLGFWIIIVFPIITVVGDIFLSKETGDTFAVGGISFLAIIVIVVLLSFFSSKLFNSRTYSSLLTLENGDFQEDIKEISFSQIPKIDRDTAKRLGDRKMGEIVDLVSQFNVADDYTQISVKGKPVRVSPLKYNGFFKWFNNRQDGIPGYVQVDMVDGQAKLVQLEKNIKYSKTDKFGRNIYRYLRFNFLTSMFGEIRFEIDDNGHPFYIAPIEKANAGLFGAKDTVSVVLVDAVNGDIQKYKLSEVPQWIDRVYDADSIISQLNWNGSLHSGYWNSKFAEKGVTYTTEGYNYLSIDNDVYLYTGITSSGKDESNIGFVLVNMRTKETKFYQVPSAEEYSAMETAEGAVQEKEYVSTFPILLNIDGKPTYFVSLKDNAGLIKMYGFIDAENYQKVSVSDTVEKALAIHKGSDAQENEGNKNVESKPTNQEDLLKVDGVIEELVQVVINGNTHYYILIEDKIYLANISINPSLVFFKSGNKVEIEYIEDNLVNQVYQITKIVE